MEEEVILMSEGLLGRGKGHGVLLPPLPFSLSFFFPSLWTERLRRRAGPLGEDVIIARPALLYSFFSFPPFPFLSARKEVDRRHHSDLLLFFSSSLFLSGVLGVRGK